MRSVIGFGVVMLALTACGGDRAGGVANPGDGAATVALSATSSDPMASAGDTREVTAVARDAYQSVISAPSLSWGTSAPSVATVTGSGDSATVTAVGDGTAVITAASGAVQGTITVAVHRKLVSIVVSAPDSVVVAGLTTQLAVVGLDARQHEINGLTDVKFVSDNAFSIQVSPSGLVSALFSPQQPFGALVTVTVSRDGVTLSGTKRIDVASPAPPAYDFFSLLLPEDVRPEPVSSAAQGIVYFTLNGARVDYKLLWSLLSGPAVSAQIHGPDDRDSVAAVLVDLPLGTQSSTNGVLTGSFSAADIHPQDGRPAISLDSLVSLMKTQRLTYVDIRNGYFTDGELRGPIYRRQ